MGPHTGHVLTHAQGKEDAPTWADYINIGMEHGAFDMAGLAEYMRGLVDGGPTRSGHRAPAVIVELPGRGTDPATVAANSWQVRQILARGARAPSVSSRVARCSARLRGGRPLSPTRRRCRSGSALPARAYAGRDGACARLPRSRCRHARSGLGGDGGGRVGPLT